ncbi:MAG: cobalamin biosynthesis protein [Nocardioidaceae bacterium]|nr:cobalamin biosynthesis protein [Nocardioidaceae bacterium]
MQPRATGLALGFVLDRWLGDPRRLHPVAGFGTLAAALERSTWADDRAHGVVHCATLVGAAALLGVAAERTARRPAARTLATAAATWVVLGGRSLEREAVAVARYLDAGDLAAAREQVTHLVGRDPSRLGPDDVARATVESVAENTSDAVVAPLLAGAVAGVPGLLAYRAANTLDAMVGHRSERYRRFGWASARLDDLLNLVPARTSALLAAACAPLVGGRPSDAVRAWRRDAALHPSPNAGPVEAAFAGALGRTLGGSNVYGGVAEDRGTLGDGPSPGVVDVRRATRLAAAVGAGATLVAVGVASLTSAR